MLSLVLCTTFLLEAGDARVVGKSYDWDMGQGLVMVNKRGVAKQGLPLSEGDHPPRWLAKFSSVTFNQYGRELPNGGMNDAGLVVEVMWLDSSIYPPRDQRPSLSELQWIQYQLDNFASVKEMRAAAQAVRVSSVYAKVHYLACDRSGDCAAFENLDGKMVVSSTRVLTNHSHAESVAFARAHARPPGTGSLERFARASDDLGHAHKGDLVTAAFSILDDVSQGPRSVWNIVYDPVHLKVWFRTAADHHIKSLDFSRFDKSCASAVRLYDLTSDGSGDVTDKFVDYSEAKNRGLVEESTRSLAGKIPPGAVEALIHYPSMLECTR